MKNIKWLFFDLGHTLVNEDVSQRKRIENAVSYLNSCLLYTSKVLSLRFGLEDGHPRTLEEVGKEFNVTRERIRCV